VASVSSTRSTDRITSFHACGSASNFRCTPAPAARSCCPHTTRNASIAYCAARFSALTPHTITTRRALRQELEQVRARGYATTVDELEEGLASVSVGIFGDSRLLGVLNVSGLSQRLDEAARRRAADSIRDVVDDIESALERGRRAAA
jgi:DNA-binding IclR family transcriptional regulator